MDKFGLINRLGFSLSLMGRSSYNLKAKATINSPHDITDFQLSPALRSASPFNKCMYHWVLEFQDIQITHWIDIQERRT